MFILKGSLNCSLTSGRQTLFRSYFLNLNVPMNHLETLLRGGSNKISYRSGWSLGVAFPANHTCQWAASPEEHQCHLLAAIHIASPGLGKEPTSHTAVPLLFCFIPGFSGIFHLHFLTYLLLPILMSRVMLRHRQFWGQRGQGRPAEQEESAGTVQAKRK